MHKFVPATPVRTIGRWGPVDLGRVAAVLDSNEKIASREKRENKRKGRK